MPNVGLPLTTPDLVCVLDVAPFAIETTSDLQNLTQDILHLLKELPGSNADDPNRGVGVETYLNGTADAFTSLVGLIEAQIGADDRVSAVSCIITKLPTGSFSLRINIGVAQTVIPLQFGWQNGNFTNISNTG